MAMVESIDPNFFPPNDVLSKMPIFITTITGRKLTKAELKELVDKLYTLH